MTNNNKWGILTLNDDGTFNISGGEATLPNGKTVNIIGQREIFLTPSIKLKPLRIKTNGLSKAIKIKPAVQTSFDRIKKAATNNVLRMSIFELKENGVVNHSEPIGHLKKLKEVGWLDYTINKAGNKNPMVITILEAGNE